MTDEELTERRKRIYVGRYGRTLDEYWKAPSSPDTELGYEWQDKPHRLLYDLIAEIERLHGVRP